MGTNLCLRVLRKFIDDLVPCRLVLDIYVLVWAYSRIVIEASRWNLKPIPFWIGIRNS